MVADVLLHCLLSGCSYMLFFLYIYIYNYMPARPPLSLRSGPPLAYMLLLRFAPAFCSVGLPLRPASDVLPLRLLLFTTCSGQR